MRDKEIVGLYQAYLDVYSNSNEEVEQLDESGLSQDTIRSAAKKRLRRVDADYREDTPEGDERGDKGMKKLDRTKRQLKINEPREVRMRANEEVENWVNSLIEEGYDMSEYTWDDMYEMYVTEGPNYDRNRQRAAQRAAARNAARKEGKTGNVPGVGYVSSRPERETYRDSAGVERHTSGAKMPKKEDQKESFDLFDAILEHLVAEGYADTNESAIAIMSNMSEEWRQSIVEAIDIPRPRPTKYIAPSRPLPAPAATTPKPDMSTPKDKEIGRRISQTPIGMRLTGPTGPLR